MPAAGTYPLGATLGLRTVILGAGQMEWYMSQGLSVAERSIVTGQPYATFLISLPITLNQVLTVSIIPPGGTTPTAVQYTVTTADMAATDPLASVAPNFASKISGMIPTLICDSAVFQVNPRQVYPIQSTLFQIAVQSLTTAFTLTSVNLPVTQNGSAYPYPSFQVSDGNGVAANAVYAYGLLPVCEALEQLVMNAQANLSFSAVGSPATGQAVFRQDELVVRDNLFQVYKRQLGTMLGFYAPSWGSGFGVRV